MTITGQRFGTGVPNVSLNSIPLSVVSYGLGSGGVSAEQPSPGSYHVEQRDNDANRES